LSKDEIKADRHRPERRARRKRAQAIDTIFQGLRRRPAGSQLSAMALLNEIVTYSLHVDGLDDDEDFWTLRLIGLLARDERMLALLPKRDQKLLQRDAAHWLRQAEQGGRDLAHPLVFLHRRLDQALREGAPPTTVTIRQAGTVSIFRTGNWPFLLAYALGPGDPEHDDTFEIILSRTGQDPDNAGSCEIAAGVRIEGYRMTYLTAEEFRQSRGTNLTAFSAGAPLRFVDADNLVFHDPGE
jgi:hypothetical protein